MVGQFQVINLYSFYLSNTHITWVLVRDYYHFVEFLFQSLGQFDYVYLDTSQKGITEI